MRSAAACAVLFPLLLLSTQDASASTAELVVDGRIVPSACTMTLSRTTVDLGNVQSHQLNASRPTALTENTVTLSVACRAAARYALTVTDDRAASVAPGVAAVAHAGAMDADAFGLGTTARGNIGAYVLAMSDALTDGAQTRMARSSDGGTTWADSTLLPPGSLLTGWRGSTGSTPGDARNSSVAIILKPAVVGTDQLDLSAAVDLDGRAVIELVYL